MTDPTPTQDDLGTWHPLARRFAFLATPQAARNALVGLGAGLALTVALGVWAIGAMDPKKMSPWESFVSWALWGAASAILVFLASAPLRALFARAPDYYGPEEWTGGLEGQPAPPLATPSLTSPPADARAVPPALPLVVVAPPSGEPGE